MPALQDPNGLTRIRAAEMLLPVAPEAAMPVLLEAAKDPNPVVRGDVTRVLDRHEAQSGTGAAAASSASAAGSASGPMSLDVLRRLLRDPDAATRLRAAGTILSMAGWAR
jgi:HEAT repeat protein